MAPGRDPDKAMFADELRAMRKHANLSRDALRILYEYAMDSSRKLDRFEQWLSRPTSAGDKAR